MIALEKTSLLLCRGVLLLINLLKLYGHLLLAALPTAALGILHLGRGLLLRVHDPDLLLPVPILLLCDAPTCRFIAGGMRVGRCTID